MGGKYAGMTVNERLYSSGWMNKFDEAVEKKATKQVRTILEKVELTEGLIKPILEKLEL